MKHPRTLERPDEDWCTLAEAAELSGYALSTVRTQIHADGAPPAVKYKKLLYVRRDDVLRIWCKDVVRTS